MADRTGPASLEQRAAADAAEQKEEVGQSSRQRQTAAAVTNFARRHFVFRGLQRAQKSHVDFLTSPSQLIVGDGEARKSKKIKEALDRNALFIDGLDEV